MGGIVADVSMEELGEEEQLAITLMLRDKLHL